MKVRLTKGLSYTTPFFSCKKGKVVPVSDEVGAKLLKTGRFEEVTEETASGDENPVALAAETSDGGDGSAGSDNNANSAEISAEEIEKMKKDELIALAAEKGIDISGCSNNKEREDKIKEALGFANLPKLFE